METREAEDLSRAAKTVIRLAMGSNSSAGCLALEGSVWSRATIPENFHCTIPLSLALAPQMIKQG